MCLLRKKRSSEARFELPTLRFTAARQSKIYLPRTKTRSRSILSSCTQAILGKRLVTMGLLMRTSFIIQDDPDAKHYVLFLSRQRRFVSCIVHLKSFIAAAIMRQSIAAPPSTPFSCDKARSSRNAVTRIRLEGTHVTAIPGAKTKIPAEPVTCEHICDSK
jgi:hypothetical protein